MVMEKAAAAPVVKIRDVLLTEEQIRERVGELAEAISRDYAGQGEVLLIGVLRGAFIFLADLVRRLRIPARIDFIAVSSYAQTTVTTGAVRLVMDVRTDIAGRHVIIVEDIVDSGYTLRYLRETLSARRPASLKACALVQKPDCLKVPVEVDYLGFDIPDVWVVGYGLDCLDQHRGLPYIAAVEPVEKG
jgi:hypoxanthine phosphoribosyltransferase